MAADVTAANLVPLATAIGETWANELVRALRAEDREVVGAWPGTMSEARMRVLSALRGKLDVRLLHELARHANLAARRGWMEVSQADPEP